MKDDLFTLTLVPTSSMNNDLERAAAMSGRSVAKFVELLIGEAIEASRQIVQSNPRFGTLG
jgi:hypothetical protein